MRCELFFAILLPFVPLVFATSGPEGTKATIHGKAGIILPAPPSVETSPVVDEYKSGTGAEPVKVTDNYRWLEDAKSPATRAYIESQNAYTKQYLDQLEILPGARKQIESLLRVDFIGMPVRRGDRYFFAKRLAAENQASLYLRTGLHGADERLVDVSSLGMDQNTSVTMVDLNESGSLMAYGVRLGGADEEEIHFLDVATRKERADVLPRARYYGVSVSPDGKGVYYSRFFPNEGTRVSYRPFNTSVAKDRLILGRRYRSETLSEIDNASVYVTDNGHYLVLVVGHGVPAKREDILVKDLRVENSSLVPLVYGVDSRFTPMDIGDTFYVDTDYQAPKHRVLKAVIGKNPDEWQTIVPEGKDVLEQVSLVDHKFYVLRLKDVKGQLSVYSLDGKAAGQIAFPAIGSGSTVFGRANEADGFYNFQSITSPATIYHYDTKTGRSDVFAAAKVPFITSEYEVRQVFYASKDGTRVPMFIAGRKGLKRDGSERLLMTGYGGFALSMTPTWNAMYAWWLQQGGWFALPDLRGGNEYGEAWHKAAMFEKKQNVFDDWFAAAEYLIHEKYTTPERFAIAGRSNGGLLMGASMTQRPELFGAIWCGYPLLDMLRYQRFLMGRTWTTEYGSAENPNDFPYIYRYSPYQHVKAGASYPAILFFTGDGDTRVDPMNARKMNALMQTASGSGRPILLHYSIEGGHSAGVSQAQLAEDYADEMAFLWNETGSQ